MSKKVRTRKKKVLGREKGYTVTERLNKLPHPPYQEMVTVLDYTR